MKVIFILNDSQFLSNLAFLPSITFIDSPGLLVSDFESRCPISDSYVSTKY